MATEFAGATIQYVRSIGIFPEIHALALPSNAASIRILEKLGMKRRGALGAVTSAEASLWYHMTLSEA